MLNTDASYDLVYADPPWEYRDKSLHRGGAARHYNIMSFDDLCVLPVDKISNKNSILFLWATFPNIAKALVLMESWGFEYKTLGFVWVKTNANGSVFTGMGHYTRSNSEVCLLGKKGKGLPRLSKSVHSVVISPRLRHSEKPNEVRKRIERLYGTDISRIELFARKVSPGWTCWGDEI